MLQRFAKADAGIEHNLVSGNAVCVQSFQPLLKKISDFAPSRLFIYYNERTMEHTIDSDSGSQIRDGIKSVGALGDCPET